MFGVAVHVTMYVCLCVVQQSLSLECSSAHTHAHMHTYTHAHMMHAHTQVLLINPLHLAMSSTYITAIAPSPLRLCNSSDVNKG